MELSVSTILGAFVMARRRHSLKPPATEEEILAAEEKIGAGLPAPLHDLYAFTDGGWTADLGFFPLERVPERVPWEGLTKGTEEFIREGYRIPEEVRMFASEGGACYFGIWLPETKRALFENPVIELARELIDEDGCMGIAGTNLTSFLLRRCVLYIEEWRDRSPEQLTREQRALDVLRVPNHIRPDGVRARFREHILDRLLGDEEEFYFREVRKWADPFLPDVYGTSYDDRFSAADLRKMFG